MNPSDSRSGAQPELATLFGALAALVAFVLSYKTIGDLDFWWHLSAGRWMVENGKVVTTDPFSLIHQRQNWTSITWGYEVLIYLLHRFSGGFRLVTLFHALLATGSVIFAWRVFLRLLGGNKDPASLSAGLLALTGAMLLMDTRWINRPEMLSYFIGIWMLDLLTEDFSRRKGDEKPQRSLWLLPFIQLVWVNSHGLYILGPVCIGTFIAARWLREKKIRWNEPLLRVLGVTLLMFVINPRGIRGATWPFHLFWVFKHPFYRTTIPEGATPFSKGAWGTDAWALIAYAALLLLSVVRRKTSLALVVFFALLAWFAVGARRNIALLACWTAPWVAAWLGFEASLRVRAIRARHATWVGAAGPVAAIALVLLVVTNLYRSEASTTRFGGGKAFAEHPEGIVETVHRLSPEIRFFSTVHVADYMLFAAPGFRPYIDGRFAELYPLEHFQRYMDVLAHPHLIGEEVRRWSLNGVALESTTPLIQPLIHFLATRPDWKIVDFDPVSVVFVRAEELPKLAGRGITFPSLETTFTGRLAELANAPLGWESAITFRSRADRALASVRLAQMALLFERTDLAARGLDMSFALEPGFQPALEMKCVQSFAVLESSASSGNVDPKDVEKVRSGCIAALKEARDPVPIEFTLGLLDFNTGRPELSLERFERVTKRNPLNPNAFVMLARSYGSLRPSPRIPEAERAFREAARLRPQDASALEELAALFQSLGLSDRARAVQDEAQARRH